MNLGGTKLAQTFNLPKSNKCIEGSPEDLVVKSTWSLRGGSAALRQVIHSE